MPDVEQSSFAYSLLEAIKNSDGMHAEEDKFLAQIAEIARRSIPEPEFRVLTAKGERKGVRLEPVFWHALDVVADELSVPRNALALTIMSLGTKDHANTTSLLRSFLIQYFLMTRSMPTNGRDEAD